MILHIVRHPRAEPGSDTVSDADRGVTKKGVKEFLRVLKRSQKAGMDPDVIFCGPEKRNQQGAELARAFFGLEPQHVITNVNFGTESGSPKDARGWIAQWVKQNSADGEVLALGSNPVMADLFRLIHGGAVKLKKGSVATLQVEGGIVPSSELVSYLTPQLARSK